MKKKNFYSLGIMSGSSIDGLDMSLIMSDGKSTVKIIYNQYYKFDKIIKEKISKTIKYFNLKNYIYKKKLYLELNLHFTNVLIDKLLMFFEECPIHLKDIDLIGLHGNTIYHNPFEKISIQIGDSKKLAMKFKKPIVCDFRQRDILNGGQGAPLVPIFHKAIFKHKSLPTMVINIGGISNFTYIEGRKLISSDIGPGNVLIDNYCKNKFGKDFDYEGKLSKKGKILKGLLNEWKKKPFLNYSVPISYDNFYFKVEDFIKERKASHTDILRTLTYFTAYSIKNSEKHIPKSPERFIICGGGSKNKTIMNDLKKLLDENKIFTAENFGYDSSFIESQAFAYISIRTFINLSSSFNSTTGVKKNTICGTLISPEN